MPVPFPGNQASYGPLGHIRDTARTYPVVMIPSTYLRLRELNQADEAPKGIRQSVRNLSVKSPVWIYLPDWRLYIPHHHCGAMMDMVIFPANFYFHFPMSENTKSRPFVVGFLCYPKA